MYRADFRQVVVNLVRDDEGRLSDQDIDQAMDRAIDRFSRDKPRYLVEDITPTTQYMDLPVGWVDQFSQVMSIENPVGNTPPSYLPNHAWCMYLAPAGESINLVYGTSGVHRVTYSVTHQLTESMNTMPREFLDLVAAYCASLLCMQLATFYSGSSDSTIAADTVDHGSRGDEYERRAATLRARYYNGLGIEENRANPASATVNMDISSYGFFKGRKRLAWPRW